MPAVVQNRASCQGAYPGQVPEIMKLSCCTSAGVQIVKPEPGLRTGATDVRISAYVPAPAIDGAQEPGLYLQQVSPQIWCTVLRPAHLDKHVSISYLDWLCPAQTHACSSM